MAIDVNVLNQYETALQLMNTEIQKLLVRNDQLVKENTGIKTENEKLKVQCQLASEQSGMGGLSQGP